MKKITAMIVMAIVMVSSNALARGFVEDRITFKTDETVHTFIGYVDGQVKSSLGWSAYFQTNQYWSEAYVGPTWSPKAWLSLSASIGVQTINSGSPVRYASSLWMGNKVGSVIAFYERGATSKDIWWKVKPLLNIKSSVKIGAILEKGKDAAPMLEISIAKTGLAIWGAYYDSGSQLGVKFNF